MQIDNPGQGIRAFECVICPPAIQTTVPAIQVPAIAPSVPERPLADLLGVGLVIGVLCVVIARRKK